MESDGSTLSSVSSEITDYIKPVQLTKESAGTSAQLIADMVRDGRANPLDVSTRLQWMAGVIEVARKLIQDDCVKEVMKHNGGKAVVNGAKVEKAETGTKYLYQTSGDPEWDELNEKATKAEEAKKERENFLKSLTKPVTIAVESTGEMVTIVPPQKSSTSNIKITFE